MLQAIQFQTKQQQRVLQLNSQKHTFAFHKRAQAQQVELDLVQQAYQQQSAVQQQAITLQL